MKAPAGPPLDQRELGLARQLIEMLESEFQPQEYHDEFRERVLEMLAAKAQGKQVRKLAPKRREPEHGYQSGAGGQHPAGAQMCVR